MTSKVYTLLFALVFLNTAIFFLFKSYITDFISPVIPSVLISLVTFYVFARWVSRQINLAVKKVREAAEEIRDGNFSKRINYDRNDEIGEIFQNFNQMLNDLQAYQSQQRDTRAKIKELANISRENPNPVIRLNSQKEVIFYNRAATEIAKTLKLKMGKKVPDQFYESYLEAVKDNTKWEYDKKIDGKDFKVFIVNNKKLGTINIYCWDISKQTTAEKKLISARDKALELSQVKSRFLATMSHEIRTPMNGIIGLSAILSETQLTDEQSELLQSITLSANSLLSIINDILDFSKIEAGKMAMEVVPFDLHRNVADCIDLFKVSAIQKNIDINYELEEGLPKEIASDPSRVRQVLVNLIGNAVKFTEKGKVTLSVSMKEIDERNCELIFAVKDTGIGIDDKLQHKLFQDFSQVDGSITRKFGGTGLGLAISKSISKLLGGDIWVESTFGEGSTFFFSIQTQKINSVKSTKVNEIEFQLDESFAEKHPLKIAIAEDNMVNQMVIDKFLNKLGYQDFSIRDNGHEIVELIKDESFDVILMDMQMPLMSGVEASIEIIDNDDIKNKPFIIAMTANAMAEDKQACEDAGMRGYIAKPIKIDNVALALIEAFQEKQNSQKAA
ncbi:MAG: ATP-binding protein [Bdellovibrionota bacterium]|nr:ATP-binding protein [Bdellovibrionota bacterium]